MISRKEYESKSFDLDKMEESWEREKELILRKQALEKEKESLRPKKKKISTTKIILTFLFINCTVVEVYSMWVMYKFMDLSALYALITTVVGEVIAFAIYAVKSTKENTVGGIVYEQAKVESGVG